MTVRELIEALQRQNPELPVKVSREKRLEVIDDVTAEVDGESDNDSSFAHVLLS